MANSKESTKSSIFSFFQKLGPALVPGIAIAPLGGLLLALGTILTNTSVIGALPFLGKGVFAAIALILQSVGNLIIGNLSIIFCVSMAFTMCDKDGVAALSAVVAYLTMHTTISAILGITAEAAATDWINYTTTLGVSTVNMGVLGGLLAGGMVVIAYQRFKDVQLPSAFSFFSGKRFVPIMSVVFAILIAIPVSIIWPAIQSVLAGILAPVVASDTVNPLILVVLMMFTNLLIPVGLHVLPWVIYSYQIGSYVALSGEVIHGLQNIYFAQMADHVALTTTLPLLAAYMSQGIFTGYALAFYRHAKQENKGRTKSLMVSTLSTNIVTGITEPFAFSFLFSCFPLYICYTVMQSVFALIGTYVFQIHLGTGYCGGLIDYIIYGPIQGAHNWFLLPVLLAIVAATAYFIATFFIKKLHAAVPGQEDMMDDEAAAAVSTEDDEQLAETIIEKLGGAGNIKSVDACATRLRVAVSSMSDINKDVFKEMGAAGVVSVGNNLQIIYGTKAALLSNLINNRLKK